MSRRRKAGIVGGLLGGAAAVVGTAIAVERVVIGRAGRRGDKHADENLGGLVADRVRTVRADDGVALHVEEDGPESAPLTVVFVHGYTLALGAFHFQRKALRSEFDGRLRLVLFDQRSHGRSGRSDRTRATLNQMAKDLRLILDGIDGPIVLVGHSMGGMAIIELAADSADLFGGHVVGVALISTSSGALSGVTLGLPGPLARAAGALTPAMLGAAGRAPWLVESGRRLGADLAWFITHRMSFGSGPVSPAVAEYLNRMIAATPVNVVADFYPTIMAHERRTALAALGQCRVAVVCGAADRLTPLSHSKLIASEVRGAQLHVIDDAGHAVVLERPDEVDAVLVELVREVLARLSTGPRRR
ncbi:MAG: alpha/beta hydrolase fold protein [Pseudonocardiales bacterium]|nr:alpha/beta hydrolase fold protein [Jatrophihabitantaceae bacterium]MCW2603288.1 alpha/beta hydrolase fold protein [Pseudonocardiales bacterium]